MKRTKLVLIVFIYTFSLMGSANTNPILTEYFTKVYSKEKNNFLNCIDNEGLSLKNQIYSNCKISEELKNAAFIVFDKKSVSAYDFLDHISAYKKINKVSLNYPRNMQYKSEMGYLIIKFDIDKNGRTKNHEIIERHCGNVYNPRTEFISCNGFDRAALTGAKKLKYEPTSIDNVPVVHKGILHSKLIASIKTNKFEKALDIANKNLEKDSYFLYQKAVIKFYMKDYKQSIELFNKFSYEATQNKKEINYEYHVTSFSMLIAALFNLGQYQKIVDLEKNYQIYIVLHFRLTI